MVGEEFPPPPPVQSFQNFLNSVDKNAVDVFRAIFDFAKLNGLVVTWGSKGFSANVPLDNGLVVLFFGYPRNSVFRQSIYTGFESIKGKVKNSEDVAEFYKQRLEDLGFFVRAGANLKWLIDKPYSENEINRFLMVVQELILKIKERASL